MTQHRHPTAIQLGLALAALIGAGLIAVAMTLTGVELPRVVRVSSVADLQRTFAAFDYSLDAARGQGRVPPLAISDVPGGWEKGLDTAARKQVFFETVLPLVLIANDRVRADQRRLANLAEKVSAGEMLGRSDRNWLAMLAERYDVDWAKGTDASRDVIATLRQRVGPVPPSLALAQAAVESAYGTSRFAVAGNALFGQWTSGKNGLTPQQQRASKAAWSVAAYGSPLGSVEAYLRNLNTHRAYRDFRRARQSMERGGTLSGPALAPTLASYSEKGPAYTETLRQIIRTNRLAALDRVALEPGRRIRVIVP